MINVLSETINVKELGRVTFNQYHKTDFPKLIGNESAFRFNTNVISMLSDVLVQWRLSIYLSIKCLLRLILIEKFFCDYKFVKCRRLLNIDYKNCVSDWYKLITSFILIWLDIFPKNIIIQTQIKLSNTKILVSLKLNKINK